MSDDILSGDGASQAGLYFVRRTAQLHNTAEELIGALKQCINALRPLSDQFDPFDDDINSDPGRAYDAVMYAHECIYRATGDGYADPVTESYFGKPVPSYAGGLGPLPDSPDECEFGYEEYSWRLKQAGL